MFCSCGYEPGHRVRFPLASPSCIQTPQVDSYLPARPTLLFTQHLRRSPRTCPRTIPLFISRLSCRPLLRPLLAALQGLARFRYVCCFIPSLNPSNPPAFSRPTPHPAFWTVSTILNDFVQPVQYQFSPDATVTQTLETDFGDTGQHTVYSHLTRALHGE